MSRARGNALQNALARYLARWWEHAESAGAGRNGSDVLGTPGVVWECKTAFDFKRDFRPAAWVRQSMEHAHPGRLSPLTCPASCQVEHPNLPVVVYFPPGVGEANTANAMAIMPMHLLMHLLEQADYTPENTSAQKEAQI